MAEQNTAWLLREWAIWISEGSGIDLRVKGTLQKIVPSGMGEGDALPHASVIGDTDALRVDRAMAKLKLLSPQYHKCLFLTFCFDYSDRRIAGYFGISRRAAGHLYEASYCWIDDELQKQFSEAA